MNSEAVDQKALSPETASSPNLVNPTRGPDKSGEFILNPGSAIAALWIQTSQDPQPPASIPCSIVPVSTCPQCHHRLNLALNTSGLQNCVHCGWIG